MGAAAEPTRAGEIPRTRDDPPELPDPVDLDPLPRRWAVFVVVALSLLMFSIDQTAVSTALTTLSHGLAVDLAWASWTITVAAVGQILALPFGGWLTDQLGKRAVYLTAVGAFTLCAIGCGVSQGIEQLIVLRFLQGVAGGIVLPAASAVVAHAFGRDRDVALALFTSVFPFGTVLGPLTGGLLVEVWSWRAIFLINVPFGLVLVIGGLVVLTGADRAPRRRSADLAGAAMLIAALISTMVAITIVGSPGAGTARPVLVTVAAVAALAFGWRFLRRTRRHPDPIVPLRLLTGAGLSALNVTNICYGAAVIGSAVLLPLLAQSRYGMSPFMSGVPMSVRSLGIVACSAVAVATLRRAGHRPLLLSGFASIIVGLLLTALPSPGVDPVTWLCIGSALAGFGVGLAGPATSNAGLHLVPGDVAAVAGLRVMFRQIGGILTISVVTATIAATGLPGTVTAAGFAGIAALLVVGAIVAARLPNHAGRW